MRYPGRHSSTGTYLEFCLDRGALDDDDEVVVLFLTDIWGEVGGLLVVVLVYFLPMAGDGRRVLPALLGLE